MYDVVTLHQYIERTGDFLDPISRQAYEKHELMRLDRMSKKSFKLAENKQMLLCKRDEEVNRVKLVEYFSMEACNILESFFIEQTNFSVELEEKLTPSLLQISDNMSSISLYHEIQILKINLSRIIKESNVTKSQKILLLMFTDKIFDSATRYMA